MDKNYTILLMSGGSIVGLNVLTSVEGRRDSLRLVATNSLVEEPILFNYDAVYHSPPTDIESAAFVERFQEIVASENPDLIIPCRDEDVFFLAQLRENTRLENKAKYLCGSVNIARLMLNKNESYHFAKSHGLPFATTISASAPVNELSAFIDRHGFPLIAKPIKGFASKGVSLLTSEKHLNKIQGDKHIIIQEYLGEPQNVMNFDTTIQDVGIPLFHTFESIKYSIQVYINYAGEIHTVFATCNKMVMGKSEKVWLTEDSSLLDLGKRCGKVFSSAGWRGPLNIQCEQTPHGSYVIYEFNGRFTGATNARYLIGHDEVGMALLDFGSIALTKARYSNKNKEVIRLPQGNVIDITKVEQLQRDGFWEKSDGY